MTARLFKAYTPGVRFKSVSDFKGLTRIKPEKTLLVSKKNSGGRNNRGIITAKGRGNQHKQHYRLVDFQRKITLLAKVFSIEYDPNRTARISLLHYENGSKKYILTPRSLRIGSIISNRNTIQFKIGNSIPLKFLPLGSFVHNVELTLGKGGQIARAAGTYSQLLAKELNYVILKLPSGEIRLVHKNCCATLGQVGNLDQLNVIKGKAGRSRWFGKNPTVRGIVQNPIDHPHGGGEGRSPIGRQMPVTPWGKPALGFKTRKRKNTSNQYILRKR